MPGPDGAEVSAAGHEWLDRLPLPAVIIRKALFVYVNDAFLQLLALTRKQALGMRFDDRVAPEDRERIAARHQQRLRGEPVPNSYELTVIRGDGERRTVEIFVSQAGEDTLFQLHDVTGRADHQRSLQQLATVGAKVQREHSEAAIFTAVGLGMRALSARVVRFVPDADGVRLVEVLGAPGGLDELGKDLAQRRPWSPGLRKAWVEGYAFLDDLRLSAARFVGPPHEQAIQQSLEGRQWLRGAIIRLDIQGTPRELLLITALWLHSEDQPTLALFGAQIGAAIDAALVIGDLSLRNAELTALNHIASAAGTAGGLEELFAHASRELAMVTGCSMVTLYLLDGSEARLAHQFGGSSQAQAYSRIPLEGSLLRDVVRTASPRSWTATDFDVPGQQLMAQLKLELVVAVPMVARGRVIGVINTGYPELRVVPPSQLELISATAAHLAAAVESNRLIEDVRRSYDELSRAQAQLVQRERLAALGEMAAALAHEVRNPLGVIFNSLASLPRAIATGQQTQQLVTIMKEESDRINHLVGDLLDFARPTQPLLSDELPLRAAVEEAVGAVLADVPVKVSFELINEGGIGAVSMDARLMRQVFLNLANNAVQAMPQGGTLKVCLERKGSTVRVTFEDTGQGIPAEVMPRVFEPFFTTRARGTGLGLALVKRILEGHRGEVEVSNGAACGTRVVVAWPGGA